MGFTKMHRSFGGMGPHNNLELGGWKFHRPTHTMVSVAQSEERSPVKGLVAGANPVGDP